MRSKPARKSKKVLTRQKQEPSVGIFWWWQGRLLAETVVLSQGEEFRGVVNGLQDHVQAWPQFQKQFPVLADMDYIEVPRGRVLYRRRTRKFVVYLDPSLAKPEIKAAIVSRFKLPARQTKFDFDPHYTTHPAVLDSMFAADA